MMLCCLTCFPWSCRQDSGPHMSLQTSRHCATEPGIDRQFNERLVYVWTWRTGVRLLSSFCAKADLVRCRPLQVPAGRSQVAAGPTQRTLSFVVRQQWRTFLSASDLLDFAIGQAKRCWQVGLRSPDRLSGQKLPQIAMYLTPRAGTPMSHAQQCLSGNAGQAPNTSPHQEAHAWQCIEEVQAHLVQVLAQPRSLAHPASAACVWLPASRQIQF